VKSEKDDEKKKEIELHDIKMKAQCKEQVDGSRAEMLGQCAEQ